MNFFQIKWPQLKFNKNDEPHFVFIITPPYSGSTILTRVINSSDKTMILHESGEGQWLIPGLCMGDRWNELKTIDYDSIKSVWLNKYQYINSLTQNVDVVIEKSPPNMMRLEKMLSLFQNHSLIVNNRNPYANCVSTLYRTYDVKTLKPSKRIALLRNLAETWLQRSVMLKGIVEKYNAPLMTYEKFCQNPTATLTNLALPLDIFNTIDTEVKVKVKDYKSQGITNQNDRQISNLSVSEIDVISSILENNKGVVDYFGYEILL